MELGDDIFNPSICMPMDKTRYNEAIFAVTSELISQRHVR